jgi:hypothetical protein
MDREKDEDKSSMNGNSKTLAKFTKVDLNQISEIFKTNHA